MEFHVVDRRNEDVSNLRKCQLTQLYLLDVFKEICEANNLRYFLCAGTLLGAIRHGGAIPWDDDLDVAMPINDYRRFLKLAPKVLPEFLMLQTPRLCPGCFAYFAKLRDRRTTFVEFTSIAQHPSGIYIDIFPVERFPRLPKSWLRFLVGLVSYAWRKGRKHRTMYHGTWFGVFVSAMLAMLLSGVRCMARLIFDVAALVFPGKLAASPECGGGVLNYLLEDATLYPFAKVTYEHGEYCAPHDFDRYLTTLYGDWRTPPPLKERAGKHTKFIRVEDPMPSKWSWPTGGFQE